MTEKQLEQRAFLDGKDLASVLIESYMSQAETELEITASVYILKSAAAHLLATYLYNRYVQVGDMPRDLWEGEITDVVMALIRELEGIGRSGGLQSHKKMHEGDVN